jgi:antitoxin component YwqK of YwqJK toxin-antitoxin module
MTEYIEKYYDNNKQHIEYKGLLVNGKKEGEWIEGYFLKQKSFLSQNINNRDYLFLNGNFYYYSKINYINNKINGILQVYTDDDKLEHEYTYSNGIKNGPYKIYYSFILATDLYLNMNYIGNIMEEGEYVNGEKNGINKIYYKNGLLKEQCTFIKDEIQGPYKIYTYNGELYEESEYKYGLKNGPYKLYRNGKIFREGEYIEDCKTPFYKEYNNGCIYFGRISY